MTITKIGKNQYKRPSGVIASKDDKYFYWSCTVSNIATFANAERFKKVVEAFGSEKNLIKDFVCREAKKYLAAGWKAEDIAKLVVEHKGELPKLNPKVPRDPRLPKKVKKQRNKAIKTEKVVKVVNGEQVEEVTKVYPWSHDPQNYFRSEPVKLTVEDLTRYSCPNCHIYYGSACQGCPLYDGCILPSKHKPEDWKNTKWKKKQEVVVKPINSFEDEIPVETVA